WASPAGLSDLTELALADKRHWWDDLEPDTLAHGGLRLAELSAPKRERYFAALLPSLAPYVARAWEMLDRRPYQRGLSQRPFRAPGSPKVLAPVRAQLVVSLARLGRDYREDVRWLAAWAPHVEMYWPHRQSEAAWVMAAAIDAGGPLAEEVLQILYDSAAG